MITTTSATTCDNSATTSEIVFIIEDNYTNASIFNNYIATIVMEKVESFKYIREKQIFPPIRNMKMNYNKPILPQKVVMNKNSMRRNNNRTQTLQL